MLLLPRSKRSAQTWGTRRRHPTVGDRSRKISSRFLVFFTSVMLQNGYRQMNF